MNLPTLPAEQPTNQLARLWNLAKILVYGVPKNEPET